jgi:hypothetical protein
MDVDKYDFVYKDCNSKPDADADKHNEFYRNVDKNGNRNFYVNTDGNCDPDASRQSAIYN